MRSCSLVFLKYARSARKHLPWQDQTGRTKNRRRPFPTQMKQPYSCLRRLHLESLACQRMNFLPPTLGREWLQCSLSFQSISLGTFRKSPILLDRLAISRVLEWPLAPWLRFLFPYCPIRCSPPKTKGKQKVQLWTTSKWMCYKSF